LFDNKKLDIDLNVDGEVLKEVIITDKNTTMTFAPEMSLNKLSISLKKCL
jgi:hypothetical protein